MSVSFPANAEEAIENLQGHIALLKKKADDTLPKNLPLTAIKPSSLVNIRLESWFTTGTGYYNNACSTPESIDRKLQEFVAKAMVEKAEMLDVHEANLPIIENNKALIEKITFIMKAIGVAEFYSTWDFPTSRSRQKKETKHRAGYQSDLTRTVQITDSYSLRVSDLDRALASAHTFAAKLKNDMVRAAAEIEKTAIAQKKVKLRMFLQVKYEQAFDCEDRDILDAILAKNKYLYLGYYLEQNRNDWNDGPSYAECGLNGFHCETEEDHRIHDSISDLIENWEQDGRVFRDCEYGYHTLYGMVDDESLMKDFSDYQEFFSND